MNRTSALDRLSLLAAADYEPKLSILDLELLIDTHAQAVDADGNAPSDEDWTPTYSVVGVSRAVKAAFEVKAAREAGAFDFQTDGQTFNRSQKNQMLMAMADSKRSGINSSTSTG